MKVLVLGAGRMGYGAVFDLIKNSPDVETVAVADMDRQTFDLEIELAWQRRIVGRIRVAVNRAHRRDRLQLRHHGAAANVARVKDQLDTGQRVENARAH